MRKLNTILSALFVTACGFDSAGCFKDEPVEAVDEGGAEEDDSSSGESSGGDESSGSTGALEGSSTGVGEDEDSGSTGDCDPCVDPDPALHYTFDGHLDDLSGNGYHGVAVYSPYYVSGIDGAALVFDEDHPYFKTAHAFADAFQAALRDEGVTVSFRWRPSQFPSADNGMLMLRDPGPFEGTFAFGSTPSQVEVRTPVNAAMLDENPTAGMWVTQTLVVDKGMVTYYVDGELRSSVGVDLSVSVGSELLIGAPEGSNMRGRVDDLKIWLRPLRDEEVTELL